MIPTWIIEDAARQRAERERRERAALHIEAPARRERAVDAPADPPRAVIVIDILRA